MRYPNSALDRLSPFWMRLMWAWLTPYFRANDACDASDNRIFKASFALILVAWWRLFSGNLFLSAQSVQFSPLVPRNK